MFLAQSAGNARLPSAYKSSCPWLIISSNAERVHPITEYSCSCVFNSVVTKLMVLKHFAILSITINQVFFFLNWYQTGLTQMADTVIGGSVGPGLSGGQVSSVIFLCSSEFLFLMNTLFPCQLATKLALNIETVIHTKQSLKC